MKTNLTTDTDRCVLCGLCLPQCPTYAIERNEADSPRGRILLIKALAQSQIETDESMVRHLESCLFCRRCEVFCPAQVPFSTIMDRGRQLLFATNHATKLSWWLQRLVLSRLVRQILFWVLFLYRKLGIQRLLSACRYLGCTTIKRLDNMLANNLPLFRYDKEHNTTAQVALFSGCIAEVCDSETLTASHRLLQATVNDVAVPDTQTCCGALHQHTGDSTQSKACISRNAKAFADYSTVVSCASGCGAQLSEHQTALGIHHVDIHSFMLEHIDQLQFRPLHQTVALHIPCTMLNSLKNADAVVAVLSKIDGLVIKPIPESHGCCGAAGVNMLKRPHTADSLLNATLDTITQMNSAMNISMLLTTNLGCAMHFRQGLAQRHLKLAVMHPISLLERQLIKTAN